MHYDKVPLAKLKVPEGKWSWNEEYTKAKAIKWWGVVPPSRFSQFSKDDQAYMIVTYETEMKIQAYQQFMDRLEQEKASLKHKSSED